MWLGIVAIVLALTIGGLLWREVRLTKRQHEWRMERAAFDERRAAAALRILPGSIDVSQRRAPVRERKGAE